MENLVSKLKKANLSDMSVKLYSQNIQRLNKDFKNLNFLKKKNEVLDKISEFKPNTQRNYLISIVAALGANGEKDTKVYKDYHELMMNLNKSLRSEESKHEKTATQRANWMEWDSIMARREELKQKVEAITTGKKQLSEFNYNQLLNYLILCLYTMISPRRNNDFTNCFIVKKWTENMDDKKNYLDLTGKKFIFNVYKTSKTQGTCVIDIPDELMTVIKLYLNFHPSYTSNSPNVRFLVNYEGNSLPINGITLRLNTAIGGKIGCSMLRHIYLTHKFGNVSQEMEQTAENMGHSTNMQKEYIKK
jgi:integrase